MRVSVALQQKLSGVWKCDYVLYPPTLMRMNEFEELVAATLVDGRKLPISVEGLTKLHHMSARDSFRLEVVHNDRGAVVLISKVNARCRFPSRWQLLAYSCVEMIVARAPKHAHDVGLGLCYCTTCDRG